jgi:TRAP-type transport system small permease protein
VNASWKTRAAVLLRWVIRIEQLAAVGLLATILAVMGLQVVARYVFLSPIPWSEEVARLCMIWLTFIAAGFVAAQRGHIAVDLFGRPPDSPHDADSSQHTPVAQSGKRRRPALSAVLLSSRTVQCVVLASTLLLLIGGLRFVWRVYPVASPGIGLSMTYWYGAASVGLALMALHSLADVLGIEQSK